MSKRQVMQNCGIYNGIAAKPLLTDSCTNERHYWVVGKSHDEFFLFFYVKVCCEFDNPIHECVNIKRKDK